MSLKWACTQCGKEFEHPTFVIEHIVVEHFNGRDILFTEMMQWIVLRAVPEKA